MSALLDRMRAFWRLGWTFGGKRDFYKAFGYEKNPTFEQYLGKFQRQDIAARIITAPARATWHRDIQIYDSSGRNSQFNRKWQEFARKSRIFHYLQRADILAGLGYYSVLLFGFDSGSLETPLSKASEVLYLQPYSQDRAKIAEFEDDQRSPRYLLPKMYQIEPPELDKTGTTASVKPKTPKTSFKVHHSRVLHVAEDPLESDIFGTPKMQRVYNLLDDLLKVVGGSAETFWLTGNRGIQANVDKDMELDVKDEKNLSDELDEYMHELRRIVRTRGVEMNVLGSDVPNPKNHFELLIVMLAGAVEIPARILLGSERGQLASEQDRANWANRIMERRESFAEPLVLTPTVTTLIEAGVLPEPRGDILVEWPDPFVQSPLERAQTMAQRARSAANLQKVLDSPNRFMDKQEARDIIALEGPPPEADTPPKPESESESESEEQPPGERQQPQAALRGQKHVLWSPPAQLKDEPSSEQVN